MQTKDKIGCLEITTELPQRIRDFLVCYSVLKIVMMGLCDGYRYVLNILIGTINCRSYKKPRKRCNIIVIKGISYY